jgi:hypothetical protein
MKFSRKKKNLRGVIKNEESSSKKKKDDCKS